jgi:hypothetical protein
MYIEDAVNRYGRLITITRAVDAGAGSLSSDSSIKMVKEHADWRPS